MEKHYHKTSCAQTIEHINIKKIQKVELIKGTEVLDNISLNKHW